MEVFRKGKVAEAMTVGRWAFFPPLRLPSRNVTIFGIIF
jgi:hypothetical protein